MTVPSADKKAEQHALRVEMQNSTVTFENRLAISYKVMYILPYDPAIPYLAFYLRETKSCLHTNNISTQMFLYQVCS